MTTSRSALVAAGTTAAFAFAFYVARLCPTLVLEGDSAEIVTAAALWGVPHAPGFPAFTALGHLMTMLPVGEVAWRVHLTSTLFHAATVFVVVLLTARLTRSAILAAFVGIALGLSRAFFVASLYAEVFPLNDLFFAVLLLLAHHLSSAKDARAERRWLFHGAWVFGLALAHHPMILFSVPALLFLSGRPLGRQGWRGAILLFAAAALPFLASYAFVPIAAARDPALSFGDVHDLTALLRLVLRLDYGGPLHSALHEPGPADVGLRLSHWTRMIVRSFSVLPIVAAAGLVVHARAKETRREALALGLAILFPGPLFAMLNVHFQAIDEGHVAIAERFTTMALIPLALALGLAGKTALGWAARGSWRPAFVKLSMSLVGALLIFMLAVRVRDVDLSAQRRGIAYARDLLRPTPDRALVFVAGDLAGPAALYVCEVDHACGDRVVLVPGLLSMPWYATQASRRHPELVLPSRIRDLHRLVDAQLDARPVFVLPSIMAKDPELSAFDVTPALLLFRLTRAGSPRPDALSWGQALLSGDDTRCAGCRLERSANAYPSMANGLVSEYAIAMKNHAVVAREIGAVELARALDEQALHLGQAPQ